MTRRAPGLLLLALPLALALAGCPEERQPCALWDCDGACVDVRVDAAHCGGCGSACAEGQVCSGGTCAVGCDAPLAACEVDGAPACVAVRTDARHCGACAVACPAGQVCAAGACALECAGPLTACGAGEGAWCADLSRDRLNCGGCGEACSPGWACDDGACVERCSAEALCDGACVDLWTDARHCGACGNACGPDARCEGAVCLDACALGGLARCGEACSDLAADPANCGACGRTCVAGALCARGECAAPACAAGLHLPGRPDLVASVRGSALLAADLDGDDVPDLLVHEYATRTVLHRGLPAGGLAAPEDARLGTGRPSDAADLDGDGDRDLLVVRPDATVAYVNDGSGHFGAGTSWSRWGTVDARAADLDRDGRLDVVMVGPGDVDVRLAAGAAATHAVFGGVRAVRAGDVDGDGWLDLVAGLDWTDGVVVLRNAGDGTFAPPASFDPGGRVEDLELGDLDDDGDADVLVLARFEPTYEYALGVLRSEAGALVPADRRALPLVGSWPPYDLLVEDLDGDGRLDAAVGLPDGYDVFVNAGNGSLEPSALAPSRGAERLAAVDVDRDGRVDLVSASAATTALELRLQRPGGTWDGPEVLDVEVAPIRQVVLADLDGDGRDDLVAVAPASAYEGRPLGTLELHLSRPPGLEPRTTRSGFGWSGALAGDLDRDGAVDLVVLRDGAPVVLRNRGDGVFGDEVPVAGLAGLAALGDVTGDGVLDLVAQTSYPYALRVAVGYGNGGFAPPVETPVGDPATALAVADVDGDGRADAALLVREYPDDVVRVHPGRADGTLGPPWERALVAGASATATAIAAGDLDGDGRAELAALLRWVIVDGVSWEGAVAVLRGEATGPGAPALHPRTNRDVFVEIGRVSGGTRRDVVGLAEDSLGVHPALEDGALAPEIRWALPGAWGPPAVGDLDGDHRGDVAVPAGGRVYLYRGACPAP